MLHHCSRLKCDILGLINRLFWLLDLVSYVFYKVVNAHLARLGTGHFATGVQHRVHFRLGKSLVHLSYVVLELLNRVGGWVVACHSGRVLFQISQGLLRVEADWIQLLVVPLCLTTQSIIIWCRELQSERSALSLNLFGYKFCLFITTFY